MGTDLVGGVADRRPSRDGPPGFPDREARARIQRDMELPRGSRVVWSRPNGRGGLEDADALPRATPAVGGDEWLGVREAHRWGDSYFRWVSSDRLSISLPLSLNQRLIGGVSVILPQRGDSMVEPRQVAGRMRRVLESENLINAAAMRERARVSDRERLRAEAIHHLKGGRLDEVREHYWRLEPALCMAIRKGDRPEARRMLNIVLLNIYQFAGDNLQQVKGYILDLVAIMSRTLIDCGADPARLLGDSFTWLSQLASLDDEKALSDWVRETFENLIGSLSAAGGEYGAWRARLISGFIREHCQEPLTRDETARRVGLSPAHFSRVLRAETGRSFTELLRQARIERAIALLRRTERTILDVALDCGFQNASHFTRVFRTEAGMPPSAFRKKSMERA